MPWEGEDGVWGGRGTFLQKGSPPSPIYYLSLIHIFPRGETVDGVHFWNPGSTTLPKGGFPASYGVFEAGAFRVFGLDGRLLLEHRPSAA